MNYETVPRDLKIKLKVKHMYEDNFNKTCKNKRALFTYSFNFTGPL